MSQIALPLSFDRQFSFENYFTDSASFLVASLTALIEGAGESIIGLWGGVDSGKTHLLNASAQFARERALALQLYDGWQLLDCDPAQFDDIGNDVILAIDNLDALCGHRVWEETFYRLINQSRDQSGRLMFSLSSKPQDLVCELADFQSRLSWGLLLELPGYSDIDIQQVVKLRSELLGIELSKEVLAYLLTHFSRRLSDQIQILRILDKASLSAQKKVTIPLIKKVLIENPSLFQT
ncbi:MAG: DnaA/Hda family protein [Gammaproteobacteria bacterium]|nr:DnaA/Hda family protein [Gammaproteobacteria bacterium]